MSKNLEEIEKELAHLRMKALQAQMNPLFIYNAMDSIMDYVMNEDKYSANQYLVKFAKVMQLFLEASKFSFIYLAEELELIHLYVDLEKLRFKNRLDFKISYDKELPIDVLEIPSMLIQPFIEDAIHHNLNLKEEKGKLEMRISLINSLLKIEIEVLRIDRKFELSDLKQPLQNRKTLRTETVLEKIKLLNSRKNELYSISSFELKDANGQPNGLVIKIDLSIQD